MAKLFRDVSSAVENTLALSPRLQFELADLGYEFPRYPVSDNETMDAFYASAWKKESFAGMVLRKMTACSSEHENR